MRKDLSPDIAAYLAGLIDGEGTITLSRRHSNECRQLVVSIVSTERDLLQWVLHTVEAGKVTRKRTVAANHAPSFTFSVSNRQALSLLSQVAPWLRTYKSKRASLALSRYVSVTPRNGRYNQEQRTAKSAFDADFLAIRPGTPAGVEFSGVR